MENSLKFTVIKNDTEKKITSINNNNDIEDSFIDDDMKISKRKDFSFEDEEEIETVLELNGNNKNNYQKYIINLYLQILFLFDNIESKIL